MIANDASRRRHAFLPFFDTNADHRIGFDDLLAFVQNYSRPQAI